ncbi:hypothetical protein PCASD_19145 [Puccinia coronata f. sp. avenae]|uniref:Checkpoint protein n=1 Tax=Puccinia coronata f. sp. avenae TaxID=200324 RepID=A0A2N5TQ94_9BASI|nr:hypothetical protein PCASD_19145 [Puccinia coronata f. sp. avenae]
MFHLRNSSSKRLPSTLSLPSLPELCPGRCQAGECARGVREVLWTGEPRCSRGFAKQQLSRRSGTRHRRTRAVTLRKLAEIRLKDRMRFRAELANVAMFTKLVDSVSKLGRRAVFRLSPEEILLLSTGEDEDGLMLHGAIKPTELFGLNYLVQSANDNEIPLEFSTQALASAIRQTLSSPTEIAIRLGRIGKTAFLSLTTKTAGTSGAEYVVEQRVAVRILKPRDAQALPKPNFPVPDVIIHLPKVGDLCKVAERLKSLSDLITVSASHNGGLRLGISTEHARVETEWRDLTVLNRPSTQPTQDANVTPRPTSAFFHTTVKSRALLRFLHANITGVSLAAICEGFCIVLYNYVGDSAQLLDTDDTKARMGFLSATLPIVNEDGDT